MDRETISLWEATSETTDYDALDRNIAVDVAVVGGGITGLTTALKIIETGRSVAVLEGNRIVTGTTGNTTAKLTAQHGVCYADLLSTFGYEYASQYAAANQAAIEEVSRLVEKLSIEESFERLPATVYTTSQDEVRTLQKEAIAAQRLGIPAEFISEPNTPVPSVGAVRLVNQAQLHPRSYLLAVAEEIVRQGGRIYEETRAVDLTVGDSCRIETTQGSVVTAKNVVAASLFPFADRGAYFARMHAARAYLLAVHIDEPLPSGMYLSNDSPPWTIRPYRKSDRELLIIGGQGHTPTRQPIPATERYQRCEEFARSHFTVNSIEHRWSAHDYVPADGVPYIGHLGPFADTVYVATGFNKWGMSGGTAAALIITGLIETGAHPWEGIFDPMRLGAGALASMLKENGIIGKRWVTDQLARVTHQETALPKRESGTVIRERGRPIAIYRDADGELQAMSAVCPHLWCIVEWNDADSTWDCPCHGSRFNCDGSVYYGPARRRLSSRSR